jgi:ABC-type nitrate/sulfonate/bicarbonate transport system substrate-binding protein
MNLSRTAIWIIAAAYWAFCGFAGSSARAEEVFRIAYGGYNETAGPMWVGIEKGIFRKHGIDASMIQVRSGALRASRFIGNRIGEHVLRFDLEWFLYFRP